MRIAAIFATMNRSATALACVRALAAQTLPPNQVIVADNLSSDTTANDLETLSGLPFPLDVLRMEENAGNAGGIAAAMERAFADGADAVWILDDDSWPRPAALEELLAGEWDSKSVRHALQVDPATGRYTWPMLVQEGDGSPRLIWSIEEMPPGDFVESLASWTGALIPRAVHDACGPVMAELFIRGEDEEYPARIARAGFRFYACRRAVMDHPGPRHLVEWKFLGRRLFYEAGIADWKLHYKIRNMVWLNRRDSGNAKALLTALAYTMAALHFDGPSRLPLVAKAALEGWRGKLGRIS